MFQQFWCSENSRKQNVRKIPNTGKSRKSSLQAAEIAIDSENVAKVIHNRRHGFCDAFGRSQRCLSDPVLQIPQENKYESTQLSKSLQKTAKMEKPLRETGT